MNDQQREALRRALNALKAAQRGDLDSQWNREAIADVEAALTQPQAQQAIKQDLTTEQQAAAVPAGFKLIKDSTREERSWPEDYELDNGRYFNTCCNCERLFLGHKRRIECKACATAAPPAPVLPLSDEQLEQGRHQTFSTSNPFCPCDSKTFRKVARWVEHAHGIPRSSK